jgi:hypothetical protein
VNSGPDSLVSGAPLARGAALWRWGVSSALAAGLVLLGALLAWLCIGGLNLGIDDADITLVYAKNISAGHGFVYNVGGERVEGSTSLLWTLIASAAAWVASDAKSLLIVIAVLLTIAALTAVMQTVLLVSERLPQEGSIRAGTARVLIAAWMMCLPDFFAWNVLTLMDVAVWNALIAAFVCAAILHVVEPTPARMRWLALWAALLVTCRPEAMVLCPAVLVAMLSSWLGHPERFWRGYWLPFAAFVLTLCALVVGRYVYFGYPLPNTFYAKAQPDPLSSLIAGAGYLKWYLTWRPWVTALVAVNVWIAGAQIYEAWKSRRPLGAVERAIHVAVAVVLVGLLLPVPVGGDHFGSFRFYAPFAPFVIVPVLLDHRRLKAALRAIAPNWSPRLAYAAVALMVVLPLYVWNDFRSNNDLAWEFEISENGRAGGALLDRTLPNPKPRLAVVAAGGVAVTYTGPVLDLMGLNWVEMAHSPRGSGIGMRGHLAFNLDVFHRTQPEIVLLSAKPRDKPPTKESELGGIHSRRALHTLLTDDQFRARYEAAYIEDAGALVAGYFLKAWSREHAPAGYVRFDWW